MKEIIADASELPPEDVDRFVVERCGGDATLLAEVRSLLSHRTQGAATDTSSPSPLVMGAVLGRRYRLRRQLGVGGFAVTWLADDLDLHGRAVVVKIPRRFDAADGWRIAKLRDEIAALARVVHPGVVSPIGTGRLDDDTPFLVMEYVDGSSLREVVEKGPLPARRVASILRQIGRALHAVLDAHIYHRDLKPDNVMVRTLPDGSDHVRLIDFGIATLVEEGPTVIETRAVGSVRYMAPEQMRGEVTPTTDAYAFGVIAAEMITRSFALANPRLLRDSARSTAGDSASEMVSALPRPLKQLLGQALSHDPSQRPADMQRYADDLATCLEESGSSRARRWVVPAAAVLIMAAAIVGAYQYRSWLGPAPAGSRSVPPVTAVTTSPATTALTIDVITERRGERPLAVRDRVVALAPDDRFRLLVSGRAGHLYLFAGSTSGAIHVLFPSPTANDGSSAVTEARELRIPQASWLEFDSVGEDTLWVVWSHEPHGAFEAAGRWANPRDRGEIKDAMQRAAIRRLLGSYDEAMKVEDGRLHLSGSTDVRVGTVTIEHR